jgi:hypothetical protein
MLKKYVSKFAMDILPSVAATIIGAYIVNHYIVTKPGAGYPTAAALSTAEPKAEAKAAPKATRADVKAPEKPADVANLPEPGVKAKGISEKAMLEKSAAEKPAVAEKPAEKPAEKSADKPAETASIPVETRRHQPAPREKATAKIVPAPAPVAPAVVPVIAAPVVAAPNNAPVEAAIVPEERRDANDLARAAIERLRGTGDSSPRAQEAARVPDASRAPDTSRMVSAPPVRPLPPPIMVSTPGTETFDSTSGSSPMKPPYAGASRMDDPRRPTPPADIPSSPSSPASAPLDLHADATEPRAREHTTVADDMLSAAKSVFHAVLPK